MNDPTLIRGVALMAPLLTAALAWAIARPTRRAAAAALLALLWNLAALVPVNLLAVRAGWWRFEAVGGLFLGLPFDLLLGWALLWGVLPAVAMRRWRVWIIAVLLVWIDLLAMPRLSPVVRLHSSWLVGEAVAVAVALIPGLLLARWTDARRRLPARAALQLILFIALVYGLLPAAIIGQRGGEIAGWRDRPGWLAALALQVLAVPAVVGLAAAQRFVTDGRGTPLPYDPPQHLVTTGPYAYVANPMQLSTCLMLLGWGGLLGEPLVILATPMTIAFCWGIARWHEEAQLAARFGRPWTTYRAAVWNWLPRWRPYISDPPGTPDRLYVAASCDACAAVGRWFAARGVVGVSILPAEEHPTRRPRRIRYESADGRRAWEGIAAVGRALERIHLGWAIVGWTIGLPIVRQAVQVLTDAVGGGPRAIPTNRRPLA